MKRCMKDVKKMRISCLLSKSLPCGHPVCVECLIGKQKKPILFKVTEPSPGTLEKLRHGGFQVWVRMLGESLRHVGCLLHHCRWGSRIARGKAESVRAPP